MLAPGHFDVGGGGVFTAATSVVSRERRFEMCCSAVASYMAHLRACAQHVIAAERLRLLLRLAVML